MECLFSVMRLHGIWDVTKLAGTPSFDSFSSATSRLSVDRAHFSKPCCPLWLLGAAFGALTLLGTSSTPPSAQIWRTAMILGWNLWPASRAKQSALSRSCAKAAFRYRHRGWKSAGELRTVSTRKAVTQPQADHQLYHHRCRSEPGRAQRQRRRLNIALPEESQAA